MNPRVIASSRFARVTILRTHSDERLAELVRQGSGAAFEAIVHRYQRPLLSHCARVVGDADAEEAVQDALINAHAVLESGSEVRSLRPWLHAVAHNAALGILRRRAARPEYPQRECAEHMRAPSAEPARAELEDLIRAVRSLPPRQRDAIVMRELEGRSYEEIGVRLGASDGAVRQLLNRARRALRENVCALTPVDPLLKWAVAAGERSGAGGALTVSGASALAAKLTGAAVLSAVSVIALPPSPHASAGGGRASRAPDPGRSSAAVLAAPPRLAEAATSWVPAARAYGAARVGWPALRSTGRAARPARSGEMGGPPSSRRGGAGAQTGRGGRATYADVSSVNFDPRLGQSSAWSSAPSTVRPGNSGQAAGPASPQNPRHPGVSGGATPTPGQQPASGPGG